MEIETVGGAAPPAIRMITMALGNLMCSREFAVAVASFISLGQ